MGKLESPIKFLSFSELCFDIRVLGLFLGASFQVYQSFLGFGNGKVAGGSSVVCLDIFWVDLYGFCCIRYGVAVCLKLDMCLKALVIGKN